MRKRDTTGYHHPKSSSFTSVVTDKANPREKLNNCFFFASEIREYLQPKTSLGEMSLKQAQNLCIGAQVYAKSIFV